MTNQALLNANIIDLLGLQNLPAERQGQLVGRMVQVVQDRITNRVIGVMTVDQRNGLDHLLVSDAPPEAVDDFMKKAVPDFDTISAAELVTFKREMQENTKAVRMMIDK